MGVITTWDQKKDDARDFLIEANRKLSDADDALLGLTDPSVWGYEEIKEEHIDEIEAMRSEIQLMMIKMRKFIRKF